MDGFERHSNIVVLENKPLFLFLRSGITLIPTHTATQRAQRGEDRAVSSKPNQINFGIDNVRKKNAST